MKRFIIINLRTGLTLFRSMYPPISPPTIPVSLNLSLFLLCSCCQVLWIMSSKHVAQCMVWHWSVDIAPASRISMRIGRPSTHSLQNASAVQLGVSQPIYGAAAICRPAHWPPVLPFVPSANNCRSEHIHRTLLLDVAVTTEQHQGKYIDLILAKRLVLNICHWFCYWI